MIKYMLLLAVSTVSVISIPFWYSTVMPSSMLKASFKFAPTDHQPIPSDTDICAVPEIK